jgi:Tol biopolymer transport system component
VTKVGVAAALALLAALAGGGHVRAGKPASVLVFAADGGVVETTADGSRSLRIDLAAPDFVDDVTPSPDGRLLAVTVLNGQGDWLELQAPRTGAAEWQVTGTKLVVGDTSWSPDSRRIAFTLDDSRLEIVTVASRRLRLVATGVSTFAWSPSGRTIAFSATRNGCVCFGRQRLALYDLGSRKTTWLPQTDGGEDPAWTPDGRTLVFTQHSRLTLAFPGTSQRPQKLGYAYGFALSPDGTRVAYRGGAGLYVSRLAANARPTRIAKTFFEFAWSPDSRTIAFSGERRAVKRPRIYLASRDGRSVHALTPPDPDGGSRFPVFSPDGGRLAYEENSGGAARLRVLDLQRGSVTVVLGGDPDAATYRVAAWTTAANVLPSSEHAVVLGSDQQLTSRDPLDSLAVDGGRTAGIGDISVDPTYSDWTGVLWTLATGSRAEPQFACNEDATDLTVAGDRFAYLCGVESGEAGVDAVDVYLATFGRTEAPNPAFSVPCCDVTLAGSGSLLVAGEGPDLFSIAPSGAQTLLRSYPAPIQVLGVNAGRILVGVTPDRLDVLAPDATRLAELPLAHSAGAVLAGDQIAALDHGKLIVETLTGQPVAQQTLPARTSLEGMSSGVVAYSNRFRQHLLRLAGGRDLTVELPGQFERASAAFDNDGSLYYAFNARWPTSSQILRLSPERIARSFAG